VLHTEQWMDLHHLRKQGSSGERSAICRSNAFTSDGTVTSDMTILRVRSALAIASAGRRSD